MRDVKPWRDAPPCLECSGPFSTPAEHSQRLGVAGGPRHLFCPACGHDWMEADDARLVKAWKAWGAWEACEEMERTAVENVRAEAALREKGSPNA